MTRITWHDPGTKVFQTGIDRGVLYPLIGSGVPWQGLVSVKESPEGGQTKAYWLDGIKYHESSARSDFKALIEAYTYPEEFEKCLGYSEVFNGLFVDGQKKDRFNFSYRTIVGNDLDGDDYGYKIHLVYNALADISDQEHNTIEDPLKPFNFKWDISTISPISDRVAPTAHFVIESRTTPTALLNQIEDILYGTDATEPRLPSVDELIFIFETFEIGYIDAGTVGDPYFATLDAGTVGDPYTETVDGGSP